MEKEKSQARGESLIDSLTFNVREIFELSRILKNGARRERYACDTDSGVKSGIGKAGKMLKDTFK
ncbi:MAG: hypothetical protein KGH61_03200 [Candidatus Micrarchaeota archaeon]|nr:hypothetical protein [Candidatus Micrarchaeota archaeon]